MTFGTPVRVFPPAPLTVRGMLHLDQWADVCKAYNLATLCIQSGAARGALQYSFRYFGPMTNTLQFGDLWGAKTDVEGIAQLGAVVLSETSTTSKRIVHRQESWCSNEVVGR